MILVHENLGVCIKSLQKKKEKTVVSSREGNQMAGGIG